MHVLGATLRTPPAVVALVVTAKAGGGCDQNRAVVGCPRGGSVSCEQREAYCGTMDMMEIQSEIKCESSESNSVLL